MLQVRLYRWILLVWVTVINGKNSPRLNIRAGQMMLVVLAQRWILKCSYEAELKLRCPDTAPYSIHRLYMRIYRKQKNDWIGVARI